MQTHFLRLRSEKWSYPLNLKDESVVWGPNCPSSGSVIFHCVNVSFLDPGPELILRGIYYPFCDLWA